MLDDNRSTPFQRTRSENCNWLTTALEVTHALSVGILGKLTRFRQVGKRGIQFSCVEKSDGSKPRSKTLHGNCF